MFKYLFLVMVLAPGPSLAQTFDGNACTDDCSGHRAGYEWGRDHNVTSEEECNGKSQSFEEGCRSSISNPDKDPETDDDGNEIPDDG